MIIVAIVCFLMGAIADSLLMTWLCERNEKVRWFYWNGMVDRWAESVVKILWERQSQRTIHALSKIDEFRMHWELFYTSYPPIVRDCDDTVNR